MAHRHLNHVVPLVVVRVVDQHTEVAGLHRGLRPEVVLECPVYEAHRPRGGFTQQPAPDEQVREDLFGSASDLRRRRHPLGDHGHDLAAVGLGLPVADQPVRQPLQQSCLLLLGQVDALDADDLALGVSPHEQHVRRGVVQLLTGTGQLGSPVPVQRAQQRTHQRVRGQSAQVAAGGHRTPQRCLVRIELFALLLGNALGSAGACQWSMKAAMSFRPIGSRECASNPVLDSQLSETADGRVVTTEREIG